jgi:hypothetical protein
MRLRILLIGILMASIAPAQRGGGAAVGAAAPVAAV